MIRSISSINPLKEILEIFPKEQGAFTIDMFLEFAKQMAIGGWISESSDEAYKILGMLEDMSLIKVQWDENKYPLYVVRTNA